MVDNQPNVDENADLDEELKEVNKRNAGGFDDENPIDKALEKKDKDDEEEEEDPAPKDPPETPKKDGDDEEEEEDEDEEDEEKTPEEKKKAGEGGDEVKDPEAKDKLPVKRPEKYIPIKQYTDEKKGWKETETELNDIITDLKKDVGDKTKKGSEEEESKLKTWAKDNNMSYEAAKGLVDIAREGMGIDPEALKRIESAETAAEAKADTAHFDTEYDADINPIIEKEFPKATKAQKAAANELMDKMAHTRKNHIYELPYLFQKNKAEFEKILTTKASRKGPEGDVDKKAVGAPEGFDPAKIVKNKETGKYDFSTVDALEGDERDRAISALEPDAYVSYIDHMDETGEVEVNRDGRKILLK